MSELAAEAPVSQYAAGVIWLWEGIYYRLDRIASPHVNDGSKLSHWLAWRLDGVNGPRGRLVHMPTDADGEGTFCGQTDLEWETVTAPYWKEHALALEEQVHDLVAELDERERLARNKAAEAARLRKAIRIIRDAIAGPPKKKAPKK